MKRIMGRVARIRGIEDIDRHRRGKQGDGLITEFEEVTNKEEILERGDGSLLGGGGG